MKKQIHEKVCEAGRLSDAEAHWLYESASVDDLLSWTRIARGRFHDPSRASYVIMRIVNHTNVCVALCDYCAFYRLPKHPEGYVIGRQQVYEKIEELLALNGDLLGFNGGFHPGLGIDWYCELFADIRSRYGDRIEFYALTVAEFMYIAKHAKLPYASAAEKLKAAGVRWVTGGGAEILTNGFRKRHSPLKYSADEFMEAHAAIADSGLNTTATMVIGFDESLGERIEHLRRVRQFQDQTQALYSFLTWTYKPYHTSLGGSEISDDEYLRHVAVCRLYLDNVKHIRASVLTQNLNAVHSLHFGADDFDIPIEDEVTQQAGATIDPDIAGILKHVRREGFEPVYRVTPRGPWKLAESVTSSAHQL